MIANTFSLSSSISKNRTMKFSLLLMCRMWTSVIAARQAVEPGGEKLRPRSVANLRL